MKTIQQAMLEEIYLQAYKIARGKHSQDAQIVHYENPTAKKLRGSYFITLHQLEDILKSFEE